MSSHPFTTPDITFNNLPADTCLVRSLLRLSYLPPVFGIAPDEDGVSKSATGSQRSAPAAERAAVGVGLRGRSNSALSSTVIKKLCLNLHHTYKQSFMSCLAQERAKSKI